MTMPFERTRALQFARELMVDLVRPSKTPGVPEAVRARAEHALRHYPELYEIQEIAEASERGAIVGSLLDAAILIKALTERPKK